MMVLITPPPGVLTLLLYFQLVLHRGESLCGTHVTPMRGWKSSQNASPLTNRALRRDISLPIVSERRPTRCAL